MMAALGLVATVTGILSFFLPSSATWLNNHGFTAWPLATLALILFTWAAANWRKSGQELEALRAELRTPVPEDVRIYAAFKEALPRDSRSIDWLRTAAGERIYWMSDVDPLREYVFRWRATRDHFINADLEVAYQAFVQAASDFVSFQSWNAQWAPEEMQGRENDVMMLSYDRSNHQKASQVQLGTETRADSVVAAYDKLYNLGSRLGL